MSAFDPFRTSALSQAVLSEFSLWKMQTELSTARLPGAALLKGTVRPRATLVVDGLKALGPNGRLENRPKCCVAKTTVVRRDSLRR
jgi:hypothetical protein